MEATSKMTDEPYNGARKSSVEIIKPKNLKPGSIESVRGTNGNGRKITVDASSLTKNAAQPTGETLICTYDGRESIITGHLDTEAAVSPVFAEKPAEAPAPQAEPEMMGDLAALVIDTMDRNDPSQSTRQRYDTARNPQISPFDRRVYARILSAVKYSQSEALREKGLGHLDRMIVLDKEGDSYVSVSTSTFTTQNGAEPKGITNFLRAKRKSNEINGTEDYIARIAEYATAVNKGSVTWGLHKIDVDPSDEAAMRKEKAEFLVDVSESLLPKNGETCGVYCRDETLISKLEDLLNMFAQHGRLSYQKFFPTTGAIYEIRQERP